MHVPKVLICLLAIAASSAWAGTAHEHGVARLDVAVDGPRVSIAMTSPLENLLGFERAPRSDAEHKKVAALLAILRDGAKLFRVDAAAACVPGNVELESAVLKLGAAQVATAGTHHDLAAHWEFSCARAAQITALELGLFDALPRLQRIEVQAVAPQWQRKLTLKRPARRVPLNR